PYRATLSVGRLDAEAIAGGAEGLLENAHMPLHPRQRQRGLRRAAIRVELDLCFYRPHRAVFARHQRKTELQRLVGGEATAQHEQHQSNGIDLRFDRHYTHPSLLLPPTSAA